MKTKEERERQEIRTLKEMGWTFVREFCSMYGYQVVERDSEQAQIFPPDDYKLVAYWLHLPLGKKLFPLNAGPLSSVVDELSKYVGWTMETEQLRNAIYRYRK